MASGLIFDEQSLVDNNVYKYDEYLHTRINKYTGAGRIIVKYWSQCDQQTTDSLGFGTHYQILGPDSPLRFNRIEKLPLLGFSPLQPEDKQVSTTQVRDYGLSGEVYAIPGTIMPKENDMFIIYHLNMNHIFRVTHVTQDGLNTDGSYKMAYELYSSNPTDIEWLDKQTVGEYVVDLQVMGGDDLTPVIGKEDYELRSRLIKMVNDMVENYISRYYDNTHNCCILHLNGRSLFDLCGNLFMHKHGLLINDMASNGNIVLNPNKIRDPRLDSLYQKSPYKWIERDAPQRYLEAFKFRTRKGFEYIDSSFALYGYDVDVMVPVDPWCASPTCEAYFPEEALSVFDNEEDIRACKYADCKCCEKRTICPRHYKCQRFDYVSLIHDFIYGKLTSIQKLSLYIGDQLFDNAEAQEIYLWTPIIIYIIKTVLKIK